MKSKMITLETTIHAPLVQVWQCWTTPADIVKWNSASTEWHTKRAENDLRVGGTFNYRMEARDGSMGFDFSGHYDVVTPHELIESTLGDGRKVSVHFTIVGGATKVVESFEAELTNSIELQRTGWQAILDNFKKYVEAHV